MLQIGEHNHVVLVMVLACFVGSAYTWPALGVEWFPLRIMAVSGIVILAQTKPVKPQNRIADYSTLLMLIMLVYGFLSLAWSPDALLGFKNWGIFLTGALFFLLVMRIGGRSEVQFSRWMRAWSFGLLGLSLLGAYEVASGQYIVVLDARNMSAFSRLSERLGWVCPRVFCPNPNNFAFINAISILPIVGWGMERVGRDRLLAVTAAVMSTIMVMLSYSRAAIGGLSVGFVFFMMLVLVASGRRIRPRHVIYFIILVFLGSLVVFYNIDFIEIIIFALSQKVESTDDYYRYYTYAMSVEHGIFNSFGFGSGLGASTVIISGKSYHHHLLEILAEFGLWILLLNLLLFFLISLELWKMIQRKKMLYLSSGYLSSCIAFPLLCIGPSGIMGEGVYWLWMALLVNFVSIRLNATN